MPLREDLLEAAGKAAAAAKDAAEDASPSRADYLLETKTALEAVGLVGPAMTPDAISAALDELSIELSAAGLFDEAQSLDPLSFLRAVLSGVQSMGAELTAMRRKAGAYMELDGFVETLAGEYTQSADQRHAGPDDPARRIVRRMAETLDSTREKAGIERKPAP